MNSNQPPQNELIESILQISNTIAKELTAQKSTLMVAESATGGLIQHFITEIPGSSNFFLGGLVAYSNELKQKLLQLPKFVINQEGAVSKATVAGMANGVRLLMNVDFGLATSGIAGPTGARLGKPIGLVFVALSHCEFETKIRKHIFHGTRTENKLLFTKAALQLLLETLQH